MHPDRAALVRECFEQALARPPGERAAYLDSLSPPDLRSEVESLLHADALPHALLDESGAAAGRGLLGRRVGRYRIVRLIGVGGMGSVYEAEQTHPRRSVALKILRPGLISPQMLRRFEYESEVLARLRHPGIAQVYEAAALRSDSGPGVPYFAMELIARARSILEFARSEGLDLRRRVDLVARICDAVHHGHQHGVIHRDLKPANILVDENGQPKVIDFGVARSTDADVTMATGVGQLVGTLRYMSPEQCAGDPRNVDTRTDVYSLGVILFELLTGQAPYDLERSAVPQAARTIMEAPPRRPSACDRALRGDLETIVLKAIEKDRERRYASAAALAADLRRFLSREPIAARPPSAVYHVRMFARRNRALVAGLGAAVIALVLGVVGTSVGLVRAVRESHARDLALQSARDSAARAVAESERARATLEALRHMLASADPERGSTRDYTVRRMLDDFARGIAQRMSAQPAVLASLQSTIGQAYIGLGEFPEAEHHLRSAIRFLRGQPGSGRDLGEAIALLAVALSSLGNFDEAEQAALEAVSVLEHSHGRSHDAVARALAGLCQVRCQRGDYAAAEAPARESVQIMRALDGGPSSALAESLNNLAMTLAHLARYAEAEPFMRDALEVTRSLHGPEHSVTVQLTANLAGLLRQMGRVDEAEALYRQAIEVGRRILEPTHPALAAALNNLAYLLEGRGDLDGARALYLEALPALRRAGAGPALNAVLDNLGRICLMQRDFGPAETFLREALQTARAIYPESHVRVQEVLRNLAELDRLRVPAPGR